MKKYEKFSKKNIDTLSGQRLKCPNYLFSIITASFYSSVNTQFIVSDSAESGGGNHFQFPHCMPRGHLPIRGPYNYKDIKP